MNVTDAEQSHATCFGSRRRPVGCRRTAFGIAAGFLLAAATVSAQIVVKAVGTGRTTGHIADLTIENHGNVGQTVALGPFLIPATGPYQSYLVPRSQGLDVAAGGRAAVPLHGYCADVFRPPVPAGEPMVSYAEWIGPDRAGPVPNDLGRLVGPAYRPRRVQGGQLAPSVPGSAEPLTFSIEIDRHPMAAAPFLLDAVARIEAATAELQEKGTLTTPFGARHEREREAVIQQTVWIYAAALQDREYGKEDFTRQLEKQYEERQGTPVASAPPAVQERIRQGADDFWDAFELIGVEAKVLAKPAE